MTAVGSEEQVDALARKRVEAKRSFYIHSTVYVLVNTLLVFIWAFAAGGGFPWFIFPLFGWGIGLMFHFLGVYVFDGRMGREAVRKEAERIRRQHG